MPDDPIRQREPALPAGAVNYRSIGPFNRDTIPAGLLKRHNLKEGTWGVVTVLSGEIDYAWDDGEGGCTRLDAGQAIEVPPLVPHHLELLGDVTLAIGFWRAGDGGA